MSGDQDDHEESAKDEVERREGVGPEDGAEGPARLPPACVALAPRYSVCDLLSGEACSEPGPPGAITCRRASAARLPCHVQSRGMRTSARTGSRRSKSPVDAGRRERLFAGSMGATTVEVASNHPGGGLAPGRRGEAHRYGGRVPGRSRPLRLRGLPRLTGGPAAAAPARLLTIRNMGDQTRSHKRPAL
jgi:hypothetical protein